VRHFPGCSLFNGEAENFQIVLEGMNFNVETITKGLGKNAESRMTNCLTGAGESFVR